MAPDLFVLTFEGVGGSVPPLGFRLLKDVEAHGIRQRLLEPRGDSWQRLPETRDEMLAPLLCFRARREAQTSRESASRASCFAGVLTFVSAFRR